MRNNHTAKAALAFFGVSSLIVVVMLAIVSSPIGIVFAVTNMFNGIGGNVVVPNTCIPILNGNTAINFGSPAPGTFVATANAQNVLNFGNTAANILIDGGNWVNGGAAAFLVSNTLWDLTKRTANNGNQLTNSITGVDTFIFVVANGGTNNIYLGVNVPSSQLAGTYTQTINMMLSC